MLFSSLGLLSLAVLGHASSQSVLGLKHPAANSYAQSAYVAPYTDEPFTPFGDLGALSSDSFTTLRHPSFSGYSIGIKSTNLTCGVNQTPQSINVPGYTGYINTTGARHIFFYFFPSRNDPAKDPVVFWTNGGPGCASSVGLFMENGPCLANSSIELGYNQYSWNSNASVFWVDQPINVGFSYSDYGETVSTTKEAAQDIVAFLGIFFQHFDTFQGLPFHMAGESYAGHYIPIFAAAVYDHFSYTNDTKIVNLASIMMGNGLVDYFSLYPTYIEVQCTTQSISPPVSDISTCLDLKKASRLCQKWTLESCINVFDDLQCAAARQYCDSQLTDPFFSQSGLNPYDISKKCTPEELNEYLCYPVMKYSLDYLSLNSTRELLGASPAVPPPFQVCNNTVNGAFVASLDEYHETYSQVAQLLERGVRALVYVGTYDWICNWISNEVWTLQMPWSGQKAFASQPLTDWSIGGKVVGLTRNASGLTYATVQGAGHMVPLDKPMEAQYLVNQWLAGKPLVK